MKNIHSWSMLWKLFLTIVFSCHHIYANPDAKRLYDALFNNYNKLIRPVKNTQLNETVLVKLGLRLSNLIELNHKEQILTTSVWLIQEWEDHKLQWNPADFGGVTELNVPSEEIWLPDIVLYNNADGDYVITTMTKAILHHSGKVLWAPPATFKSWCEIDVRFFPFDRQTCFMKFGSWTYDNDQIDLKHINQKPDHDKVNLGIDLSEYYHNVEWDILDVPAERHEKYYPCCSEPYTDIFFNITLRRKTLYYTVNLIIPCIGISYLSILVFYLPADSGEKIVLCVAILLSQTIFLFIVLQIIPLSSLAIPLLGKYLLFSMLLVGMSIVITVIILNIHYRKSTTHKMAPWVKKLFVKKISKLMLMQEDENVRIGIKTKVKISIAKIGEIQLDPGQLETQFSSEKITTETPVVEELVIQKPPETNSMKAIIESSNSSTSSSVPKIVCVHPVKVIDKLAGEGTSKDTAAKSVTRKKYPAKLEKAIKNVIFIQRHIQYQNAFDVEDQDWKFVAMILDRIFLWIFTTAFILGTLFILCEAPMLYDNTQDITHFWGYLGEKEIDSLSNDSKPLNITKVNITKEGAPLISYFIHTADIEEDKSNLS